ncbi:MAG: hypothetical protein JJT76_06945 [Clostridiaceae bacterium]|nr:hypothetical protein [Clostridiaceae bacterium]
MNTNEFELLEKKYEEMLNLKVAELEERYEKTLEKELSVIAAKFDSLKVISRIINNINIDGQPTNIIYEIYNQMCSNIEIEPMNHIDFSRFIVKWFDYVVINKKVAGKKRRIFIRTYPKVQDQCPVQDKVQDSVQDVKV